MEIIIPNSFEKKKRLDKVLNKIDTKFIFSYSKKCNNQFELMEKMLKENKGWKI